MRQFLERIVAALRRGHRFVTHDIWHIGAPGEALPRGVIIKQIRVCILLLRGVIEETIMLRASALTFATMLFIVPFLAFMFFLIQTFEVGDFAYNNLNIYIEGRIHAAVQLLNEREDKQAPSPTDSTDAPPPEEAKPDTPVDRELAGLAAQLEPVIDPELNASDLAKRILQQLGENQSRAFRNGRFDAELAAMLANAQEAKEDAAAIARRAAELILKERRNTQLVQQILELMFPIFKDQHLRDPGVVNPVEVLLEQIRSAAGQPGAIGVAGLLFVLSTVFGFMRNVEYTFNRIWGIQQTRSIVRSISDYMMITLLLPFGAAMMLGVNAALESKYAEELGLLFYALRGFPFLILSIIFILIYQFVPNTKVQFRYAVGSGIAGAGLWSLLSWLLLKFWFRLAKYQLFYSSLALVPLLLMWIYFSWLILLFGALLTFAYQNEATFALERFADKASHAYREALAVRIAVEAARRFQSGAGGLTVEDAAREWNVPTRLLHETFAMMSQAGFVAACATEPVTYLPARAPDTVTVADVSRAVREAGFEPSMLREDAEYAPVYRGLDGRQDEYLSATIASIAGRLAPSADTPEPTIEP